MPRKPHHTVPVPARLMPTPPGAPEPWAITEAIYRWAENGGVSPAEAAVALAQADKAEDPADPDDGYVPTERDMRRVGRWQITDLGAAEWAGRMWAEADAAAQAIEVQAQEWCEAVMAAARTNAAPHRATATFMEEHLRSYALEQRDASNGRIKTVATSGAVVKTIAHRAAVKAAPKEDVTARLALAGWALADPDRAGLLRPDFVAATLARLVSPLWLQAITLGCGHIIQSAHDGPDAPELAGAAVGVVTVCSACTALVGALDGDGTVVPQGRPIAAVDGWWVAADDAGSVIPGVVVDPPHVTATVNPA